MKYLSVCSGIEAASVAWEGLGWEASGFSEIEPFPCAVLNHRFSKVTNYGDLTKHENWKIERGTIDVICGGTPCQSFSVAGLRAGMADPRGNLALTFLSLCDRLRPEWIIWENVPGVLSSNGGRDLGAFLGALGQLGYGTAYRILDAQYFGVAQRRRRIFVVANATDWRRAAAVLFEPESLRGDSAKGGKARKGAPAGARNRAETVGTICADSHPGSYAGQDAYTGRLIPAVLVPPAPAPVVIDRAAFNQGEAAQYPPRIEASETMSALVARGPHAIGLSEVSHTLTRSMGKYAGEDGTGRGVPIIAASAPLAVDPYNGSISPLAATLGVNAGISIGRNGILEPEPIAFHPTQDPISSVGVTHTMGTGTTGGAATIAIAFEPGIAAREGGANRFSVEISPTLRSDAGDNQPAVAQAYAVRRLTPVECERLQGFPDGWTDIPFRGKPAADGPRYKAIGNSMAVPVMRWIGERIAIVDRATKGEG